MRLSSLSLYAHRSWRSAVWSEHVGVGRGSEVVQSWVIENVEYFRPELNVESFRDSRNVIVLKEREVEIGEAWSDQDVTAGVAPEVEALQTGA